MRSERVSIGLTMALAMLAAMFMITTRAAAQTETVLYTFNGYGTDGAPYQPYSGVIFDAAGNLYGTTFQGGTYGHGSVFELSPLAGGGWDETLLFSFNEKKGSVGYGPQASLIFDNAGNLYGTRSTEGTFGDGTVFELSPAAGGGWNEGSVHSFNGTDGDYPENTLIMAGGYLYGTTNFGGTYGYGAVFAFVPIGGGWLERMLHSFKHSKQDGMYPSLGSLAIDAAGNIYGTTAGGGANVSPECPTGCGTVFEVSPHGSDLWTEKILHNFDYNGADGIFPDAGVILDAAGNLYGTTHEGGTGSCKIKVVVGCGTLFELSPAAGGAWTETIVHSFQDNTTDGQYPQAGAGLLMDGSGNIFGTTGFGGAHSKGTVFEFSPTAGGGWTEFILHSFDDNGTDGYGPAGNLVLDSAGNLYGTTAAGGNSSDGGVVYEITP
ncbi:MAG TPA: choice-of-anchor tandem repeat GloVer-containing protein [Candidatus Sulfotelmatobacter sp.]|nr:choice-of-anchor tandem repeat GloVer-containing protein [Candidatus Sulfotelmatobacter sp.]